MVFLKRQFQRTVHVGNVQCASTSSAHLDYTFFPASDHLLLANLEPKWLVSVTG